MARRRDRFDPLVVLERGYDLGLPLDAWVRGIVDAVRPGFPAGTFVGASIVRFGSETERRVVVEVRDRDEPAHYAGLTRGAFGAMKSETIAQVFGAAPYVGESRSVATFEEVLDGVATASHESLGFSVGDGRGTGLAVGSFVPAGTRMTARDRGRWFRIVAHLGAAIRLRTRFAPGPREAEAVFTTRGDVAHLAPAVANPTTRDLLVDAVQRLVRAKEMRGTSPDEALRVFRALVDGHYSVVDWIDTDGKRFVVVHENPMPVASLRALGPREAQVAERMVEGRSNSEIGYLLGLSPGTVNRMARDVLAKLGGAKRGDLPLLFERGVRVGHFPDAAHGPPTIALGPAPGDASHWNRLSPAERAVVVGTFAGRSNAAIAAERNVSVRTVANQLAQVYARFGVRGRIELGGLLGPEPPAVADGAWAPE